MNRVPAPILLAAAFILIAEVALAGASSMAPLAAGDWIDTALAQIGRWQSEANRALAGEVRAIRRGEGLPAVLALVGVGFLYGVVHALGPGHGKAIVAAYFMDRARHWSAAIFAGSWIALGHTISGILIVLVLAGILRVAALDVVDQSRFIEIVAYAMIVAIGLWRLVAGLRGTGHDHAHHDGHGHQHDHQHDHGDCGHHHAHDQQLGWRGRLRQFLRPDAMLGLLTVASAVPCSGAMILLLFSLANGLLLVGLLGAFAISVGMALTLIVLGFTAFALRKRFIDEGGHGWLQRGMTIAGGLLVAVVGGAMLAAVFARPL
jgi:nickel/cobalt exporter